MPAHCDVPLAQPHIGDLDRLRTVAEPEAHAAFARRERHLRLARHVEAPPLRREQRGPYRDLRARRAPEFDAELRLRLTIRRQRLDRARPKICENPVASLHRGRVLRGELERKDIRRPPARDDPRGVSDPGGRRSVVSHIERAETVRSWALNAPRRLRPFDQGHDGACPSTDLRCRGALALRWNGRHSPQTAATCCSPSSQPGRSWVTRLGAGFGVLHFAIPPIKIHAPLLHRAAQGASGDIPGADPARAQRQTFLRVRKSHPPPSREWCASRAERTTATGISLGASA